MREILTGHIMLSVFLQESYPKFKKYIPQASGGVSGTRSKLHALLNKPITVK